MRGFRKRSRVFQPQHLSLLTHFECKGSPEKKWKNVISVEMQSFVLDTALPTFAMFRLSMPNGSGPSKGLSTHLPTLSLNCDAC